MRKTRYIVFAALIGVFIPTLSGAQSLDASKPVEVTADESLEWHRNKNFFKANKNVRATQGKTTLYAAALTAQYSETKKSNVDIHTFIAEGNVKIVAQKSQVFGDNATYDVRKGYAKVTGRNLKLISSDQTVTAKDKFEYWVHSGRLEAHGNAVAVREGDRIEANKMIATFREAEGKRSLKTLEALGNVVITTPDEVLKGESANYNAATDLAEIKGNVFITRGPNTLQGDRAEVNLVTNVSKIFGSSITTDEGTGRVRAVFYPGSQDNNSNDNAEE